MSINLNMLRAQMTVVAKAVAEEQTGKVRNEKDKLSTSSAIASLAAMQYIGRWDSKSIAQLAEEAHPGLRDTNAFKVRLSQARRCLKRFGDKHVEGSSETLAELWAANIFSDGITLGAVMKHFRKEVDPFEALVKKVSKLHSDDLRTLMDVISDTLAKRQATKDVEEVTLTL